MGFAYELTNISNTHNAVADWLIANPGKGQIGRAAAHFGYTQAWLSTLLGSDAFRGMMKAKQGKTFEEVVIPLQEKIAGVAHRSVEKMGEILEVTKDERLVREIGKDMLGMLGYGASTAAPVVNQNVAVSLTVDASALADARARQSQHYGRVPAPGVLIEGTSQTDDPQGVETAKLSDSEGLEMGETRDVRSGNVNSPEEPQGVPAEGGEVRGEGAGPFGQPLW
jgi:hypothetical protein